MLDLKNIEYLGKNINITNATDQSKIGLCGLVIYQTKDAIVLRKNKKTFKIKIAEIIDLEKK